MGGRLATLAGIVVSGLCGYGSLAVATSAVEPDARAALAATWTLVFLVGPAVFAPVEQALAARLLRGDPSAGAGRLAALLACGLAVVTLPLAPLLDGRAGLVAALALSYAGYAAQHVLRAVLLAAGRFRRYAAVLALDGALRLAGCVLAAVAGAHGPEPYALVLAVAPLAATAACAVRPRSPSGRAALGREVGHLLAASACSQVLVGAGPAVLKPLADADVAAYLVNSSVTRIPLLLGQALLAPLLAGLGVAVREGRAAAYRRELTRTVGVVAAVGLVTTAGFAVLTPPVVRAVFGEEYVLGRGVAAVLAASAVVLLVAQLLTQALVARGRAPVASAGWSAGVGVAVVVFAILPGELWRVLGAAAAGSVAAAAALAPAAWQDAGR